MTRLSHPRLIWGILAMATIVVASNILVQFLILDGLLTWGAFTYPLAFLVTDVMNRVYGAQAARKVVLAGFLTGVICSLIGSQVMLEYGPAVPLRIAVASGTAFLIAQLVDVGIFNRLRTGAWWRAPLVSTIIGSALGHSPVFHHRLLRHNRDLRGKRRRRDQLGMGGRTLHDRRANGTFVGDTRVCGLAGETGRRPGGAGAVQNADRAHDQRITQGGGAALLPPPALGQQVQTPLSLRVVARALPAALNTLRHNKGRAGMPHKRSREATATRHTLVEMPKICTCCARGTCAKDPS